MNDSEQAPIIPEEGEVGFVEYQDFVSKEPFKFVSGGKLPELTLRYETYGHLNAAKDNAILEWEEKGFGHLRRTRRTHDPLSPDRRDRN